MNLVYFFPIIGCVIAWVLATITFQFLFTPEKFKKRFGINAIGLLNQLKPLLIERLGIFLHQTVKQNPIINDTVLNPQNLVSVRPEIEKHVGQFLEEKLPEQMPAISMFIGKKTTDKLKNTLMQQIDNLLPNALEKFVEQFKENFDGQQFAQKIINDNLFQSANELLVTHVRKKFMQAFSISGFVIGLVLMLITLLVH